MILQYVPFKSDSSFPAKHVTRIVENLDGTQLMMSDTAKARFTICRIASSCRGALQHREDSYIPAAGHDEENATYCLLESECRAARCIYSELYSYVT